MSPGERKKYTLDTNEKKTKGKKFRGGLFFAPQKETEKTCIHIS